MPQSAPSKATVNLYETWQEASENRMKILGMLLQYKYELFPARNKTFLDIHFFPLMTFGMDVLHDNPKIITTGHC